MNILARDTSTEEQLSAIFVSVPAAAATMVRVKHPGQFFCAQLNSMWVLANRIDASCDVSLPDEHTSVRQEVTN